MSLNENAVSRIQSLIEKLGKLPDSHPDFPTVYHASNATKIDSIKTSLMVIIEREYAKSSMKEQLVNSSHTLKGGASHSYFLLGDHRPLAPRPFCGNFR